MASKVNPADLKKQFDSKVETFNSLKTVVESLERKIDDADIAAVVARRTGIPLSKMLTAEKDRLVNMEAFLSKKIQVISNINIIFVGF